MATTAEIIVHHVRVSGLVSMESIVGHLLANDPEVNSPKEARRRAASEVPVLVAAGRISETDADSGRALYEVLPVGQRTNGSFLGYPSVLRL
jgi:hypothetical protein